MRVPEGVAIYQFIKQMLRSRIESGELEEGDRIPSEHELARTLKVSRNQTRQALRAAYDDLRQAIETRATTSVEAMGGAIGAIAHIAYHLGSIRQKLACFVAEREA